MKTNINSPSSYEEYLLLSTKDKLKLLKQERKSKKPNIVSKEGTEPLKVYKNHSKP